ncbi:MAG: alanine racemase [Candidatus Methylacidiphilales bacterium]
MSRCWCEIDLNAIRNNLHALRAYLPQGTRLMPMVKADAYGHGALEMATVFQQCGCEWIGCANAGEAIAMRRNGIRTPILLLSGFLDEELDEIARRRLSITISCIAEARVVQKAARASGFPIGVHVKVDTGMGRLGCRPHEAASLLAFVSACSHLELQGFYTHFARADDSKSFTQTQWRLFSGIPSPPGVLRHCSNSAGLLTLTDAHQDMVRPGIIVFGVSPLPRTKIQLKPALTWKCRVVSVRQVPARTPLSYGSTYLTARTTRIATLAVGYGDGLFRCLGSKSHVLIRGTRCPIRGRITMDQILVEVPTGLNVRRGDTAILLGSSGQHHITANDMANWAGTIPYEIWCHITDRVVKQYLHT